MRGSAFLTDFRDLSAHATRGCVVLERPDLVRELVIKHGARDTTLRGTAMAELEAMTPRTSQICPARRFLRSIGFIALRRNTGLTTSALTRTGKFESADDADGHRFKNQKVGNEPRALNFSKRASEIDRPLGNLSLLYLRQSASSADKTKILVVLLLPIPLTLLPSALYSHLWLAAR